jgi:adenylosuccinate synthase
LNADDIKEAEKTTTTKRARRVAEFNWELLRLAASLNAPTDIALTFADYLHKKNKNAHRYEQLTTSTIRLVEEIERVAAAPVSLISTGFGRRVIIDRRTW